MSLTPEQLAIRSTRVTATDATAICGVNRYRTAHDVWLDKVRPEPREETARMRMGHLLEGPVLEIMAEERGLHIVAADTVIDPIHSWLCATPDRLVMRPLSGDALHYDTRPIGVAEAKVVGLRMARDWGDEGEDIPDYVRVQVQVQLTVTRTRRAWVAALLGTDVRTYEVEHEPELEAAILEECERFHRLYLVGRVPPPPDASASSRRALEAAWPRHGSAYIEATSDMAQMAREYIETGAAIAELEAKRELAGNMLRAWIGEHEGLQGLGVRATWKLANGAGVDWKSIATELGATEEQIRKHTRPGQRRLLVKELTK